ncbi:recombinase family protein [Streptomyces sp. NPDC048385]|uniref:recombinase family protein n=1 Tax=unclassified Streptomyces TaxID=2593676 RepID=UPI003430DE02
MIATTNAPLRAVIYTRLSNDPRGDGVNVTAQEEACRKLAASLGMTVLAPVLTDNDRSAYSGKPRPGFQRLMAMLAGREADAAIVWDADRLYRQPRDLEPLVDIVEKTGQPHGQLDLSTPTGVMLARILAAVNAQYVSHAIENMKARKDTNRRAGFHPGGPRPFGLKAVKRHAPGEAPRVPQVDPREARLIREAADALLAHTADPETGLSLTGVCRAWNARKVTTPRGNPWTVSALKKVMTSARVAGLIEFEGETVGPASWEPILDRTTWQAVRTVLRDPARSAHLSDGHGNRTPKYLGSGIYLCPCGGADSPGGSRVGQHPRYRCATGDARHVSRRADLVDGLVELTVVARLARPDARAAFSAPAAPALAQPSADELHVRHAGLTARLEALADAFADDDEADPVEYRSASRKLKERIAAVEQRLADAQSQAAAAREPGPLDDIDIPELARRHAADPEDALTWYRETYSLERRRKILKVLAVVTLVPGKQGRPPGWKPGTPYFDPDSVQVDWA